MLSNIRTFTQAPQPCTEALISGDISIVVLTHQDTEGKLPRPDGHILSKNPDRIGFILFKVLFISFI